MRIDMKGRRAYSNHALVYLLGCACIALGSLAPVPSRAQDQAPAAASKPTEHVLGTVTSLSTTAHTVTVKEDKTGTEYVIQLANTRTLLKVPPGAKDIKGATRITADDLAEGDRVDVRGFKVEDTPGAIAARSVVLMSGRDLAQVHAAESAAWQRSTPGVVTSVDPASKTLVINSRTSEGLRQIKVDAANAEFTRFSPENPKTPASSQLSEIQPGDQVRIIGDKNTEGSNLTAQKIYSNSFRTLVATVSSISPDGKSLSVKDLGNKQTVSVTLADDSSVRKLPQPMAYMLARRLNPDFKPPQGGPGASGPPGGPNGTRSGDAPAYGAKGGEAASPPAASSRAEGQPGAGRGSEASGGEGGPGARGGMRGGANGDLSQILDHLPKISISELKSGDAVIVSGIPQGSDRNRLTGMNIIAGVEPIFQSASPRQVQSLGDWGASLGGGADMGMPPQ
jgi:Domain of unknown function (DUF5666)